MKLFGKAKAAPKQDPQATRDSIDLQISNLEKRQEYLQKKVKDLKVQALTAKKAKNLNKAKQLVTMAMNYDKQGAKLSNAITSLTQIKLTIENVEQTKDIADGMKAGRDLIKQTTATINIDEVEDVQDDIAEAVADINEVSDILGRPLAGFDTCEDEDELEAYLQEEVEEDEAAEAAALQQYQLPEPGTGVGAGAAAAALPSLPAVPTGVPAMAVPAAAGAGGGGAPQKSQEESELDALMAGM